MEKILLLAGVLGLASIGGVSAYLTDFDSAQNQFTVGKVDIELDEPNWTPEEYTKIEPGKEIDKDPQITNTGVNDAFVYLEISVPMADVTAERIIPSTKRCRFLPMYFHSQLSLNIELLLFGLIGKPLQIRVSGLWKNGIPRFRFRAFFERHHHSTLELESQ